MHTHHCDIAHPYLWLDTGVQLLERLQRGSVSSSHIARGCGVRGQVHAASRGNPDGIGEPTERL